LPCAPLADPGERFSRTGLFTTTRLRTRRTVSSTKQVDLTSLLDGPIRTARQLHDPTCRFHHSRRWHLEALQEPIERLPRVTAPLAPPIQPPVQNAAGFVGVAAQAFGVSYDAIVVPVACVLRDKHFHQLAQRAVSSGFYPISEPLHRPSQFLAAGAALDGGLPPSASSPGKFKSQEVEPPVVPSTPRPKTYSPRLVRGQFQAELSQALWERLLERLGLMSVIEAADQVVREAEQL